jgi:hypothetical protein
MTTFNLDCARILVKRCGEHIISLYRAMSAAPHRRP